MKYIDEFRQGKEAVRFAELIKKRAGSKEMTFMEVCGTHTMAIARNGIREILPSNIRLISGPGCPVCVTPNHFVDKAVALSRFSDVIITTFGDMMKVPGSTSSLDKEHSRGGDIRIVTSTLDALKIAENNLGKKIIFLGIGFETTAPTVAASILEAHKKSQDNYLVLCSHKTMPEPMKLLSSGDVQIDGYICPGHVSAITGSESYKVLAREYGIACVIGGFEPTDILQSILSLTDQVINNKPEVDIQYSRVVKPEGNLNALKIMYDVFEPCDSEWRGIGVIPNSGLRMRERYSMYDAAVRMTFETEPPVEHENCI